MHLFPFQKLCQHGYGIRISEAGMVHRQSGARMYCKYYQLLRAPSLFSCTLTSGLQAFKHFSYMQMEEKQWQNYSRLEMEPDFIAVCSLI